MMSDFLKCCMLGGYVLVIIAWILPQSLFYDCVRPMNVEKEKYSIEECQKIFDVSEDEFEIAFWLGKVITECK